MFLKVPMRAIAILVLAIFVGFALLGVYWPSLHGQFFFDDLPNILAVGSVQIKVLSLESLIAVVGGGNWTL